ncbi:hypothetical protein [Chryseobacterium sp. JV274]|nr:hypothetical protein [Chryseobacterium sp. JV274]CAD0220348.1 protein of unknown function [Chryseobacterium sp. JV274]
MAEGVTGSAVNKEKEKIIYPDFSPLGQYRKWVKYLDKKYGIRNGKEEE